MKFLEPAFLEYDIYIVFFFFKETNLRTVYHNQIIYTA